MGETRGPPSCFELAYADLRFSMKATGRTAHPEQVAVATRILSLSKDEGCGPARP